jgi:hypothetical protein
MSDCDHSPHDRRPNQAHAVAFWCSPKLWGMLLLAVALGAYYGYRWYIDLNTGIEIIVTNAGPDDLDRMGVIFGDRSYSFGRMNVGQTKSVRMHHQKNSFLMLTYYASAQADRPDDNRSSNPHHDTPSTVEGLDRIFYWSKGVVELEFKGSKTFVKSQKLERDPYVEIKKEDRIPAEYPR